MSFVFIGVHLWFNGPVPALSAIRASGRRSYRTGDENLL